MHRMGWVLWLWPGLPQVCRSGSWAGLSVAVGLTILLNVAILATFGWSELVGPGMRNALWIAFGAAWLAAAVLSVGAGQRTAKTRNSVRWLTTFPKQWSII